VTDVEVVVVGAGLAGLSCAFELVDRGHDVLVLEAREIVGGRTASWRADGMPVESGLHRWLGFYKALPELLDRAGIDVDQVVCWEDEIEIIAADGGPRGVLGLAPFYKPAKTLGGLIGNTDLLPWRDKLRLARFLTVGLARYARDRDSLDEETVRGYAHANGISDELIHNLLTPLTAGIYFIPPERYSALAFFGLVAPGFPRVHRMRLGAFEGGMTDVMTGPLATAVAERGGQLRISSPVTQLVIEEGHATGVQVGPERINTRHVVLATSLKPAQELIAPVLFDHDWFKPMLSLPSMPAVTIQFELTEPITDVDRTTFGPGTCWASFAEQSRTTFKHAPGRLSVILTPPEQFLDMADDEILERVIVDGTRLGFDIRDKITSWRVVRYGADFYSLAPGHDRLRPAQKTPVPGLTLAGDYTKQPLLATMEGAVISGALAAAAVRSR